MLAGLRAAVQRARSTRAMRYGLRGVGTLALATTGISFWQYYRLRMDYKPLVPPKGAMSGVEVPRFVDHKRLEQVEEVQILFVGDSLVIGIGCPDRREGPVFARRIARVAAQTLRKRVKWKVMGIDGGDVNTMREKLLDEVKTAASDGNPKVSAVVIMCGLNDYKRFVQEGRTASAFKEDLRRLIRSIKDIVGQQARVVLPALPVDRAPLFQSLFPLNMMLFMVAREWDYQKELLSGEEPQVEFITEPTEYQTDDWAVDGIHPSEKGYTKWADHIISKILPRLQQKSIKKNKD
ncbi:hypothetical protein AAMO2058_001351400 [Amorphochlora amoebiformis]